MQITVELAYECISKQADLYSGFVLALPSLPNKISNRSCYFYLVQVAKCLTSLDRSISACAGVAGSAVHGVPGITRVIRTSDYGNVNIPDPRR